MRATHKSYEIVFDESSEEWKCGALALADKSLSKVKTAIDRAGKARRRVNVEAIHMDDDYYSSKVKLRRCTIVLIRDGDKKADVKYPRESWQSQVAIDELYAPSEQERLDAYVEAKATAQKAEEKAEELKDALTALDAAAIREIVARQAEEKS